MHTKNSFSQPAAFKIVPLFCHLEEFSFLHAGKYFFSLPNLTQSWMGAVIGISGSCSDVIKDTLLIRGVGWWPPSRTQLFLFLDCQHARDFD